MTKTKFNTSLKDKAKFYAPLYKKNNGIFYRGVSNNKGVGASVLGDGKYVTWDKGMAEAFAKISHEENKGEAIVESYKLDKDLKLLDAQSKTMGDIRKNLGVSPYDKVSDPMFARILTHDIKEKGYDGVISDDKADGVVIFDKTKMRKIKEEKVN